MEPSLEVAHLVPREPHCWLWRASPLSAIMTATKSQQKRTRESIQSPAGASCQRPTHVSFCMCNLRWYDSTTGPLRSQVSPGVCLCHVCVWLWAHPRRSVETGQWIDRPEGGQQKMCGTQRVKTSGEGEWAAVGLRPVILGHLHHFLGTEFLLGRGHSLTTQFSCGTHWGMVSYPDRSCHLGYGKDLFF